MQGRPRLCFALLMFQGDCYNLEKKREIKKIKRENKIIKERKEQRETQR